MLIEKYKDAVATVQKLALEERNKNNDLKARMDSTKILGKFICFLFQLYII